jgi:ribosome recycling factor
MFSTWALSRQNSRKYTDFFLPSGPGVRMAISHVVMKISDQKEDFENVLEHLRGELTSLRTGRANPALVDNVMVEAYDAMMNLKGVASISVPDSRTIQIDPWDKSLLKAIEKGIIVANIGLHPVIDGVSVRLNMPQLTEENRKELVKIMQKRLEEAKVAVRSVREKMRNGILEQEKEKTISEDERFRLQEELEKVTASYVEKIKEIGEEKEKEIMTV